MPTINNATVINQPHSVAGNGGRKLVRLDNGWLISVVRTLDNKNAYFYKSENNGTSWSQLCFIDLSGSSGTPQMKAISIQSKGTTIYALFSMGSSLGSGKSVNSLYFDAKTVTNDNKATQLISLGIDQNQTEVEGNSLIINDELTELHATWVSKNSTYPNSFNIRYTKGIINADGSVTWGAVVQRTAINISGNDIINPSIIIRADGKSVILFQHKFGTTYYIQASIEGESGSKIVYDGGTYLQSNPSAIYVPPTYSGTPNGRIWVAWQSRDATSSQYGLRVAYSNDGGETWTVELIRTASSSVNEIKPPSITCSTDGRVMIAYALGGEGLMYDMHALSGGWYQYAYSQSLVLTGAVSALHDMSTEFSKPLIVFTSNDKVGFYGTWSVTDISVPEGFVGTKDNPSNVLQYAITTDGTMSMITEKVNGVLIRTRNASSGAQLTVSLTDAQWNNVVYGKYATADGKPNTLTIEMGNKKWSYTFDKRLAQDPDIPAIIKSTKDLGDVVVPTKIGEANVAVRDAIVSKKGVVNQVGELPRTQELVEGIDGIPLALDIDLSVASIMNTFVNHGFDKDGNTYLFGNPSSFYYARIYDKNNNMILNINTAFGSVINKDVLIERSGSTGVYNVYNHDKSLLFTFNTNNKWYQSINFRKSNNTIMVSDNRWFILLDTTNNILYQYDNTTTLNNFIFLTGDDTLFCTLTNAGYPASVFYNKKDNRNSLTRVATTGLHELLRLNFYNS